MSKNAGQRRPVVALYGENPHDATAIKELVGGLAPEAEQGSRLRVLKSPPTLVKDLQMAKRRTRASKVVATLKAVKVRDGLRAVIFHEDADRVEPAHEEVEATIRAAYSEVPCEIIAAVPAWELETWWFLFPDAVLAVCSHWQAPKKYSGGHVGKIRDAKEELARCVRPPGRKSASFREYREEDSVEIARAVVRMALLDRPDGRSSSWDRFVGQVRSMFA